MINYHDDMKEKHQSKEVFVEEVEKLDFYIQTGYGEYYEEAEEAYLKELLYVKGKIDRVLGDAIVEIQLAIQNRVIDKSILSGCTIPDSSISGAKIIPGTTINIDLEVYDVNTETKDNHLLIKLEKNNEVSCCL